MRTCHILTQFSASERIEGGRRKFIRRYDGGRRGKGGILIMINSFLMPTTTDSAGRVGKEKKGQHPPPLPSSSPTSKTI